MEFVAAEIWRRALISKDPDQIDSARRVVRVVGEEIATLPDLTIEELGNLISQISNARARLEPETTVVPRDGGSANYGGKSLSLSKQTFTLAWEIQKASGAVVPYQQLWETGWGTPYEDSSADALTVAASKLNNRVKRAFGFPFHRNLRLQGYVLTTEGSRVELKPY